MDHLDSLSFSVVEKLTRFRKPSRNNHGCDYILQCQRLYGLVARLLSKGRNPAARSHCPVYSA